MNNDRGWTVMVVPHAAGTYRSVRLTRARFYIVAAVPGLCVLALAALAFTCSELLDRRTTFHDAQAQIVEQQQRIDSLNARVLEFNTQMADLAVLEARIRELAGLSKPPESGGESDEVAQGGRGGRVESLSGQGADVPLLSTAVARLSSIGRLSDQIAHYQTQFGELAELLQTGRDRMRCVPCIRPVDHRQAWTSSGFGYRKNPFSGRQQFHEGVDIAAPLHTPVLATGDGKVVVAKWDQGLGWLVEIDHGFGFRTRYGHNDKLLVEEGDMASRGEPIALLGSTGKSTAPHVHYEVLLNGRPQNPAKYFLN